jgi:TetR/AcrR family transcriptional regulator, cholesterol catabolism regulator
MNAELINILEKVGAMYHKYGIKSVTMDDVARELGISKKTLYAFVCDKDELVDKVIQYQTEKHGEIYQEIFNRSLNAVEELLEVNKSTNLIMKDHSHVIDYDLKKYYPDIYKKIHENQREGMYNGVLENMRKGKREGLFRQDLNEEVIAKLYVSRIMCMTDNPVFTTDEFTSPRFFTEIIIYHIRGIANEKGIQVLEEKLKNDVKND